MIKAGFFVFLWFCPEPVRGSQREENFQKTSSKARKKFSTFRPPFLFSFLFFKLVSSTLWPFSCFYLMYASFRSVTAKYGKILTPTRTRNFLLTSMDPEFYATYSLTMYCLLMCYVFLPLFYGRNLVVWPLKWNLYGLSCIVPFFSFVLVGYIECKYGGSLGRPGSSFAKARLVRPR